VFSVSGGGSTKVDRGVAMQYIEYMTRIPLRNLKKMAVPDVMSITNEVISMFADEEQELGEE